MRCDCGKSEEELDHRLQEEKEALKALFPSRIQMCFGILRLARKNIHVHLIKKWRKKPASHFKICPTTTRKGDGKND